MKPAFRLALAVAAVLVCGQAHAAADKKPDKLTEMFTWWNAAFKVPGSYTPEAFSRYFTPDAVLMLDGRVSVRGVEGWATHFQQIQSHGGSVEIIIPFKEEFQVGDKIYTYHMIKAVRNGVTSCELAAGHAVIRDGKIALVNLVRAPIDPAKGPVDASCTPG